MNTLRFGVYSFVILSMLFAIGYRLSIEPVTITSLPTSLMCERDPIMNQYLCYQP